MECAQILKGVRVVDFCQAGVGPQTTRALADAGAQVIKVESMTRSDVLRRLYPFKNGIDDVDMSASFGIHNCNKLGITLDFTKPKAAELAKRLVAISDVVAESFTPGVMDRLGLGYEQLHKVKPDIIMISMSLTGQTGPARLYRGHGPVLQAQVGLSHLVGFPGGRPMSAASYTDYYLPQMGAACLLAALVYKRRTGKGQYIDVSDYEMAIDVLETTLVDCAVNGRIAMPRGNRDTRAVPNGCYPCAGDDRWCTITVYSDEEWKDLCEAMGNPEWCSHEKFATFSRRRENEDALDALIGIWTKEHTAEEVMARAQRAGVPAGIVQNSRDLHEDPQLKHQGHFWDGEENPDRDWLPYDSLGFHLSKTPLRFSRPFPHLGQDNEQVFCGILGLSDEEFADSLGDGTIG